MTSALFGRDAELAELDAALVAAGDGRGSLFLVVGEPGIGKSALVEAFANRAAASSAIVVSGRAWEAGGAPAFWPWIEVLRELSGLLDPAAAAATGNSLAVLTDLVPEIADRVPGLVRPPALDPAGERFRLFDAITAALRWCARKGPLVVTLDDVHAADPASVALLQFAARKIARTGVVLIATYRDVEARLTPAVARELAAVAREGRTLALPRLDRADVARFVAASGAEPADLADRLFDLTEGNPLFLIESFRLLRGRAPGAAAIPQGVRDVIAARLRTLAPSVRELLEIGSILGRSIDITVVAELAGIGIAEATERLREAIDIEVIAPGDPDRYEFTHILLREVLYAELGASRRSELHARVAQALIARDRGDPADPLTEIVHHLLASSSAGSIDEAVAWSARAAERAVSRLAFEEAVAILERALAAIGAAAGRDRERCDLLLALADTHIRAGHDEPGREAAAAAAVLARRLGDRGALVRAALTYGRVITFAVISPVLIGLLEEALAAISVDDGELRAQLLARMAAALQPARDPEGPIAIAREAIELARRTARPAAQLAVLASANSALIYFAPPDERRRLNDEMAALAARLGDKLAGLRAHLRLVLDHLELGDPIGADTALAAHEQLAREVGHPAYQWQPLLLRAMRALMRGRFGDAEELTADARALAERAGASSFTLPLVMQELGALRLTAPGDAIAERAPALLSQVLHLSDVRYARLCAIGMMASARRPAAIRAAIEQLGEWRPTLAGIMMTAWAAEGAAELGDEAMARELYPLLLPVEGRNHVWGVGAMVCEGPIASVLGRLAAVGGDPVAAAGHFERSLARAEVLDAPALLAVARLDAGATMTRAGSAAERERGRRLLGQAAEVAEQLGMAGVAAAAADAHDSTSAPAAVARPTVPERPGFAIVRDGDTWAVTAERGTFRLKHSRGLEILALLIDSPDREFHVTDLLAPAGERGIVEDAGELLDAEAVAQYRRRLADVKDELDEAQRWSDIGRAERLSEEMEFLAGELSRAVGLGGRRKRAASTSERARVNVQRRVRHAIEKIAEHSPELGKHLEWAVRTGHFCGYYPTGR